MSVKLRLARFGKKHAPIFRIVAIDSRKKRDGQCLENLGTYNPMRKVFDAYHPERIEYWLSQGAIPTEAVKRLMQLHKKQSA